MWVKKTTVVVPQNLPAQSLLPLSRKDTRRKFDAYVLLYYYRSPSLEWTVLQYDATVYTIVCFFTRVFWTQRRQVGVPNCSEQNEKPNESPERVKMKPYPGKKCIYDGA